MEATVKEIHEYPARPPGYVEPLFGGLGTNKKIMEHFLRVSWLMRASEHAALSSAFVSGSGRALAEPWSVRVYPENGLPVVQVMDPVGRRKARRCGVWGGAIKRVIERWREVCSWWEDSGGRDLDVYRVELSSGAVVDLARNKAVADGEPGRWLLVGIPD